MVARNPKRPRTEIQVSSQERSRLLSQGQPEPRPKQTLGGALPFRVVYLVPLFPQLLIPPPPSAPRPLPRRLLLKVRRLRKFTAHRPSQKTRVSNTGRRNANIDEESSAYNSHVLSRATSVSISSFVSGCSKSSRSASPVGVALRT